MAHQLFHEFHDLILREERGLDVELGELRLAVGAQILIAEAAHDLVVAIEPGNHQQLLEDLRRLRQRKELARSEEHTSELQSLRHLVCRLLLEKKKQQSE